MSDDSEEPAANSESVAPAPTRRPATGLVIVNTGNGKGKTTAALGVLLRATGQKLRVIMFQFVKAKSGNWGEQRAARQLGVEIIPLGAGFTWMSKDLAHDRALAEEGWARCKAAIESDAYDIVILDELTYTLSFGWLAVEEVLETLRQRPPHLHVIITGRDAVPELIAFADLVTEMREIKHPFERGIKAQRGIEF